MTEFIAPMLAMPGGDLASAKAKLAGGLYSAETKLDGIRAIVDWDGHNLRIGNRNGVDTTHRWPEIVAWAHENLSTQSLVLDGEIVAKSGKFEDALRRDRQDSIPAIRGLSSHIPCTFIAFDLPEDGEWSYTTRRLTLRAWAEESGLAIVPSSRDPEFPALVQSMGLEGVILKRDDSRYLPGQRSLAWTKVKFVQRVTCLAIGYTQGAGHRRATFGALELAMLADTGLVSVGRVGAGFRDRDLAEIRKLFDGGTKYVPVEVQCLGVSSNNILRQPTFKGVRYEVGVDNCLVDQLETVPHL